MKFSKKSKASGEISMTSMPDIVFMLLFFFMVTTVLRTFPGLTVELPSAEKIVKIESRIHTSYLWISKDGEWTFNDAPIENTKDLYARAYAKRIEDPKIIVSFKFDRKVKMGDIIEAQNFLRQADCLKVNYATKVKS